MKRTDWESVRLNLRKGTKAKAKRLAKGRGHLVWMREAIERELVFRKSSTRAGRR